MGLQSSSRRCLLTAVGCAFANSWAWSAQEASTNHSEDWLVTPAEAQADAQNTWPPRLALKSIGAPRIEIVKPLLADTPLESPFPIELKFIVSADASIDPASFRVFYGTWHLDITRRLLASVTVQPHGFAVPQARIPPGRHRLVLEIADSQGRIGREDLRFTVAPAG